MVVRYSIGCRGRVERGREVMVSALEPGTGAKGFEFGAVGVGPESERRRVRPGKAGLTWGGGAVRRIERIVDMFYRATVSRRIDQ